MSGSTQVSCNAAPGNLHTAALSCSTLPPCIAADIVSLPCMVALSASALLHVACRSAYEDAPYTESPHAWQSASLHLQGSVLPAQSQVAVHSAVAQGGWGPSAAGVGSHQPIGLVLARTAHVRHWVDGLTHPPQTRLSNLQIICQLYCMDGIFF